MRKGIRYGAIWKGVYENVGQFECELLLSDNLQEEKITMVIIITFLFVLFYWKQAKVKTNTQSINYNNNQFQM
jgi:hypothetical protein